MSEFVDSSVQIYNGKTSVRCKITEGRVGHNLESLLGHGNEDFREQILDREKKGEKVKAHMARKGNPISVRLDLNRSSDSSLFSEGDRESHRIGQSFPFVLY